MSLKGRNGQASTKKNTQANKTKHYQKCHVFCHCNKQKNKHTPYFAKRCTNPLATLKNNVYFFHFLVRLSNNSLSILYSFNFFFFGFCLSTLLIRCKWSIQIEIFVKGERRNGSWKKKEMAKIKMIFQLKMWLLSRF